MTKQDNLEQTNDAVEPKQLSFEGMLGQEVDAAEGDKIEKDAAVEEATSGLSLNFFSNSMADLSSDDIVIPRLRLAQGLTEEVQNGDAKPGQWLLTGFEPLENVTAVPLKFARNRTLRDDAGSILCKSNDAVQGVGEPGGDCATCPLSKWVENETGKNTPPACAFSYVYIVFVVEHQTLALVEFRRTSIQAGKTLNTIAAQRGLGNFMVQMNSVKQQGKRGTFYQSVIKPVQADEDVLAIAQQYI